MSPLTARLGRGRPADSGALSILVAVTMAVVLILIGLVIDGGGKMRADARADDLAQEAARAAGQVIDPGQAIPGDAIVVDPDRARAAALAYLKDNGVDGDAQVIEDGRAIRVEVSLTYETVVAGFFGKSKLTVKGTARAGLVHGIRSPEDAP